MNVPVYFHRHLLALFVVRLVLGAAAREQRHLRQQLHVLAHLVQEDLRVVRREHLKADEGRAVGRGGIPLLRAVTPRAAVVLLPIRAVVVLFGSCKNRIVRI